MSNNILVSVVITTYNGTDSIERAIKSVLNQTYRSIEVIVVDDNGLGSINQIKTETIVKKFPSVIYIPHKINKNGSAARNTGINVAKGKYVAFLDDDDAFMSTKIEKQVVALEKCTNEYAVCYTGILVHYNNGKVRELIQDESGYLFTQILRREIHIGTSVLMIKRDVLKKMNGFDESFRRHQDWEVMDRLSKEYNFVAIPEPLIDRYICQRNSATDATKYEQNRLFYLEKMESLINSLIDDDKRYVYYFHYMSIAKEFLKEKNLKKFFYYAKKTNNIPRLIKDFIRDLRNRC